MYTYSIMGSLPIDITVDCSNKIPSNINIFSISFIFHIGFSHGTPQHFLSFEILNSYVHNIKLT